MDMLRGWQKTGLIGTAAYALGIGAVAWFAAHAAHAEDAATFAELNRILVDHPELQSLDEFVGKLPEEYRRNWAIAFHSRGLAREFTTPVHPRVIAFAPNSSLVVTFTGCEGESHAYGTYADCQALEAIDYNRQTGHFELQVYSFPGKNQVGLKPILSEKNPKQCAGCHGAAEPKPLWEPYNSWSGVYGSVADHRREIIGYDSPEYRYYRSFLDAHWDPATGQARSEHDPYASLEMDWSKLAPDADAKRAGFLGVIHGKNEAPNSDLNRLFARLQFVHLARKLVARPGYGSEKFLLGWWASCFNAIEPDTYGTTRFGRDFGIDQLFDPAYRPLPPYFEMRDRMKSRVLADRLSALRALQVDSSDPRNAVFAEADVMYYNQTLPMLVRLLEILGGERIEDWSTSFELQPYNFASPAFGVAEFQGLLKEELERKEPGLADQDCESLRQQSRRALTTPLL